MDASKYESHLYSRIYTGMYEPNMEWNALLLYPITQKWMSHWLTQMVLLNENYGQPSAKFQNITQYKLIDKLPRTRAR